MPVLLILEEALRVSSAIWTSSEFQTEKINLIQHFAMKRLDEHRIHCYGIHNYVTTRW